MIPAHMAAATVAATDWPGPGIRRVVLDVPDLDGLRLPATGDAAVGIYFPTSGREEVEPPPGRTYTVRQCDWVARRITVDIVIHGRGVGTDWVLAAAPGDEVGLAHSGGWYQPATADWQLLMADRSGLPALARILAEQSTDGPVTVLVEVIDEDELEYLAAGAAVPLVSSIGTGNGIADSMLKTLLAQQNPPTGRGYCWYAGEAGEARAVRKYLRHQKGWQIDQLDVMGYWRRDSQSWDRRYAQVATEMFAVYERAIAAGKPAKVAAEEFDAALERSGL